ncbi:hypothetical protein Tco_1390247 [Tanacetum coccineum]
MDILFLMMQQLIGEGRTRIETSIGGKGCGFVLGLRSVVSPSSSSATEATKMQHVNRWRPMHRSKGSEVLNILSSTLHGGIRKRLCEPQHAGHVCGSIHKSDAMPMQEAL